MENRVRGYFLIYNGSAWSAPSEIDAEGRLGSVSCASSSFCVAVGGQVAMTWNGSTWSTPSEIDAEGELESVSCSSSSFCAAVARHSTGRFGTLTSGYALTYNGDTWTVPFKIGLGPERAQSDANSVSCASSSFCAATSPDGETSIFDGSMWGAWSRLELNGGFSSVSCPVVSFCVLVDGAGQAFTYSSPSLGASLGPSTPGGGGGTTTGDKPPPRAPVRRGKPLITSKTGEITLEYDFPEPGEVEAYGEVAEGATLSRAQEARILSPDGALKKTRKPSKTCKKGSVRRGARCLSNRPVRFGGVKHAILTAGIYRFHIKPAGKVLAALKKGDRLTVRVTVVFTPAGTTDHISQTIAVRLHLKQAHRGKARTY
jgi:hypothetical protein